jgi:uncharacterized protein
MKLPFKGAIDCDMHPGQPGMNELVPFLPDYWRDQFENRHIDKMAFNLTSYPPNSPLSGKTRLAFGFGAARRRPRSHPHEPA